MPVKESKKKEFSRSATIEITSKEGKEYLEKNLSNWKKPLLMKQFETDENIVSQSDMKEPNQKKSIPKKTAGKRGRLSSKNRNSDAPLSKKPRLSKSITMVETVKEGSKIIGDEILGDTRQLTRINKNNLVSTPIKNKLKRASTIKQTVDEAINLLVESSPLKDKKRLSKKVLIVDKKVTLPKKKINSKGNKNKKTDSNKKEDSFEKLEKIKSIKSRKKLNKNVENDMEESVSSNSKTKELHSSMEKNKKVNIASIGIFSPMKKSQLKKSITMVETAKAGKEFLEKNPPKKSGRGKN